MSNFYMPRLNNAKVTDEEIILTNSDIDVKVYEDFTKLEVEDSFGSVNSIQLQNGIFDGLSFEIIYNIEFGFPELKTATINYDANLAKIKSDCEVSICRADEYSQLPDITLNEDGSLEIFDKDYTCQTCLPYISFTLRDSGKQVVDKLGEVISPRNSIDLYNDEVKVSTYQGKVIKFSDQKECYLAYQYPKPKNSHTNLRLIDDNHSIKTKLLLDQTGLQNLELRLSMLTEKEPQLQLFINNQMIDGSNTSAKDNFMAVADLLSPIKEDIQIFIDMLC